MPAQPNMQRPPASDSELDQLTLSIGEITLICGPSGAGKSRFLRTYANRYGDCSYLPQEREPLHDNLEVVQIIQYHTALYGSLTDARKSSSIESELGVWNLFHVKNHKCCNLSTGEYRRLQLLLCFSIKKGLYLLDDPFMGLDIEGSVQVLKTLLAFRESGAGVVLASTHVDAFLAHVDRLVLIKAGRVIVDALPERALPFLAGHGVYRSKLKLKDMSILDHESANER